MESVDVQAKCVLVRADLNVPMINGKIMDVTRIERFLPTVMNLIQRGADVIVLTHLGRPGGKFDPALSTRPVANALAKILRRDVSFISDFSKESVRLAITENNRKCHAGQSIAVLENIRFYSEETGNDLNFAKRLSTLGDIYVNDAFSCSHRAHASICGVTRFMPSWAGPSLLAEIRALTRALENPERPVAALIGGAKVSTKIGVLRNLLDKMDCLIIGGAMANTFLAAEGESIGCSLYEPHCLKNAKDILALAKKNHCEIILPVDVVVAGKLEPHAAHETVLANAIPDDHMVIDAGSGACNKIIEMLTRCRTLLWNGPLGAFEIKPFNIATFTVARAVADMTAEGKLITIAGGGDTMAALNSAGVSERFTYLSTAGGAFLEWLEGKGLPGVQALKNNQKKDWRRSEKSGRNNNG